MTNTFNNIPITGASINIICLDEVYNIYAIDEPTSGDYEKYVLEINPSLSASTDGQYSISFLGNSISNVINPQNSKGQYFYIAPNSVMSTAASICNALRACPNINASFIIYTDNQDEVHLKARNYGSIDETLQTNISAADMPVSHTGGTTSNAIVNADVNIEIYDKNTEYVTSLSKTFIKDDIAFNVSPILSTFADYGQIKQYYLESYYVGSNGIYNGLNGVNMYHTKGYKTPYSDKYISGGTKILIAKPDNYKLWTYGNIHYMLFTGFGVGRTSVIYTCYGNDNSVLYTHTDTITPSMGSPEYQELTFTIPSQYMNDTYKVKIEVGNDELMFDIIKPLKMTDGYTRVCVYNEYGGITYFDFTGKKTYSISKTNSEYEKNIYDYYVNDEYEEKKLYNIDKSTEFTLTSHIVGKDSLFILHTLSLAKKAWIEKDDGTKIPIIITSVSYSEESNYNSAYRITLKYKNSYEGNAED